MRINWSKSALLPVDLLLSSRMFLELMVVDQLKYLGILSSYNLNLFVPLNIDPHVTKITAWSKFQLCVNGHTTFSENYLNASITLCPSQFPSTVTV